MGASESVQCERANRPYQANEEKDVGIGDVINRSLEVGYCANGRTYSWTPLHDVMNRGMFRAARSLVRTHKASVNHRSCNKWLVPLAVAMRKKQLDMVDFLIQEGALVSLIDSNHCSALHYACELDFPLNYIKKFIELGCDLTMENVSRESAYQVAKRLNRSDIVSYLVSIGADKADYSDTRLYDTIREGRLEDADEIMVKDPSSINSRCRQHTTPLHIAALYNHLRTIRQLVQRGAKIDAMRPHDLATPLYFAIFGRKLESVRELISLGASVNCRANYHEFPLHSASFDDQIDIVNVLLDAGASIDARDYLSQTALHIACYYERKDMASLLIDRGADMEAKTDTGYTPLHSSVINGRLDSVKLLVERGANLETKALNGMTPLNLAVLYDRLRVVRYLIEQGADVESSNRLSRRPLHSACEPEPRIDILKLLLKSGVSFDETDAGGLTALDLTVKNKDLDKFLLLVKWRLNDDG